MTHWLIGLHAALGEIGSLGFLWVFVELLNPTPLRIQRAQWVSLFGLGFLLLSWIVGGRYYLTEYAMMVKPVIKSGPTPWAHSVIMEVKEHIFLFLPFIALFVVAAISDLRRSAMDDKKARTGILMASGILFLIGMSMAGMGYVISAAYRTSIEMGVMK